MSGWIDTHTHLWDGALVARAWRPPPPLDRTYGPEAWEAEVGRRQVGGCIFIETGSSPDELERLRSWSETSSWILGFIAPMAVDGSDVDAVLRRWAGHPKFRGVRAHFEDRGAGVLEAPGVTTALRAVADAGVLFEWLVVSDQLAGVLRSCRGVPGLRTVIEHMGKPRLGPAVEPAWRRSMTAIAAETDAIVKLSLSPRPDAFRALASAGQQGFPIDVVRAHVDVLLALFGPERSVWGSDWPVSLLTAPTAAFLAGWQRILEPWRPRLTATAAAVYGVMPPAARSPDGT